MDIDKVMAYRIPTGEQAYGERDAMLYALGVGLGDDPLDPTQLRYVYERDLAVMPTFSMVLAHPGMWIDDPALGLDWVHALHVEQHMVVPADLPASGRVRADYRIVGVADRGAERGATVWFEKTLRDAADGRELARVTSGLLCRRDGGCGDAGVSPQPLPPLPERAPDEAASWRIATNAALVYRLSGDRNPVHADPAVAGRAGLDRPILHGLCTMGIAAQVLSRLVDPTARRRIRSLACRFTKPVFPGDRLAIELWREADTIRFRARNEASGAAVLDRGQAAFG